MKQSQAEKLQSYRALVERYHRTLDLVSDSALATFDVLVDESVRYARLLSALSPAPDSLLDVGSGVGLPGVPIAASLPGCRVVLTERRKRRAAFLRIAVSQLGLDNASVFSGDVRSLKGEAVDVVCAQAVATFTHVYGLSAHLHGDRVWLLSRKGPEWLGEVEQLESQIGAKRLDLREEVLPSRGTLVAILMPGGSLAHHRGDQPEGRRR